MHRGFLFEKAEGGAYLLLLFEMENYAQILRYPASACFTGFYPNSQSVRDSRIALEIENVRIAV